MPAFAAITHLHQLTSEAGEDKKRFPVQLPTEQKAEMR